MRLRASPRNLFWMITLWSVVIIFGVVDKLLNGEVNLLSEQSGLRHLLNLGSVRHLMLDNTSSILLDEEDTRSYIPVRFYPSHLCSTCLFIFFQYDDFYVAPDWTLFDVRRRKNDHSGLAKLNFTRRDFPMLSLESTHFSVAYLWKFSYTGCLTFKQTKEDLTSTWRWETLYCVRHHSCCK